jgi:hypothetical protein
MYPSQTESINTQLRLSAFSGAFERAIYFDFLMVIPVAWVKSQYLATLRIATIANL